jgi:Ca-activated chloride channel family protein
MSNGQPMPPVATGKAAGFANSTWFGTEPAKDLDPVLTRRNFVIVLDGSGSMADRQCSGDMRKIDAAKAAIKAFAAKLGPDDNLGLCAFDSNGVTERTPLGTNNRKQFDDALNNVLSDSYTPLKDAVQLGYDVIKKQARRQLGYGQYFLVIVTDGEASSGYDPTAIVNTIVGESPVVISTVGFCIGEGHSLNRPGLTLYHDATNLKQLAEGLESVLAESEFQSNTPKK